MICVTSIHQSRKRTKFINITKIKEKGRYILKFGSHGVTSLGEFLFPNKMTKSDIVTKYSGVLGIFPFLLPKRKTTRTEKERGHF